MTYATEEHLHLLQALDNHLRWLKEGYEERDKSDPLDFDTLFEFHTRKLAGVIEDLADYFGAKKQYVQREPDTEVNKNSLGMYPGVPHKDRMGFWAKVIDGKHSGWVYEKDGDLRPYKDTEIKPKHRLEGKCGVAYSESYREKERLRKKYGDVFNENIDSSDATIDYVDERWK